jgi:hypothetical protein
VPGGIGIGGGSRGKPETAARLFGAAAAIREALDYQLPEVDRVRRQRKIADLKAALNAVTTGTPGLEAPSFERAWAAGMRLPVDAAIAEALTVGYAHLTPRT